jgi:hypothetical protein
LSNVTAFNKPHHHFSCLNFEIILYIYHNPEISPEVP